MKIEKLNENQIRCVLSKEDLESRHIRISELAYGSEKAKALFREMVQQASSQFGFEVDDIPLMVEAIPASTGNLVLVISKVEYPDELDARFSRFSEPDEEYLEEPDPLSDLLSTQGASDILDLFREMKEQGTKEKADTVTHNEEPQRPEEKESEAEEKKASSESKSPAPKLRADADLISVFEFENMEQVERLAGVLKRLYRGKNALYRNEQKKEYYLLMHKDGHTPEQFNKICNIASEYGRQQPYLPAMSAYFEEHSRPIRKGDALQLLAAVNK